MNRTAPTASASAPACGSLPVAPLLAFYATRDGQSRRIAAHIVDRLAERGIPAIAQDLAAASPPPADLARASLVLVVASVRYGRHLPEAVRFLASYATLASPPPLALASVNLTARKPDKNTAETNPYLRKLIARSRSKPALATAIAGRLDYPRYRWLDRQIIRFIMWLTGGPTDPRTCIEYTSWNAVDELASRIGEIINSNPSHDESARRFDLHQQVRAETSYQDVAMANAGQSDESARRPSPDQPLKRGIVRDVTHASSR